MPEPTDLLWLVCHTKPRCEKKFSALMQAEKLEHYLALVQSVRRYGTQTKRFTKPLFPGYVFAQVPAERKTRIYQQDLLVRAITVEDVPKFLEADLESGRQFYGVEFLKKIGASLMQTAGL